MINIYNNYYIDADVSNFMLKKKTGKSTNKKTGEESDVYMVIGYYSSIAALYTRFVKEVERDAIMGERVQSVEEFVNRVTSVIEEIKKSISILESIELIKDKPSGDEQEEP